MNGKTVRDCAHEIPVLMECDVLVVGGGPAGMAAAVGAAQAGANTVIMEQYGCLGGNITLSAVEPPSWYRQEKTTMPGGVGTEIEKRMIALDAAVRTSFRPSVGYSYDTEVFKYMADQMIKDYRITPLYHCLGTIPYMQGHTVCGVITESKSGRTAVLAKRVIDCTGDGDIMARAGAPYEKGSPENGQLSAGTLKFFLTNVDIPKLEAAMDEDPMIRDPYVHKLFYKTFQKAINAGEKPLENSLNTMYYTPMPPHDINVNLATYDRELDGTDVLSLTRSEIKLRKEVMKVIKRFHQYGNEEGLGKAKLRNFAMTVGVRETRRLVSEHRITGREILEGERFEDTVGIFPIYMDGENIKKIPYTDEYFQIPFRIIVPQKVENLLCAGRCVSCTRDAVPTTRQMDFCMVTGQAAGVASALSIQQETSSRSVSICSVQQELERQGVRVF
ncbi:putative FAD-binding dehydrogenase [uncultured Ruminococcus sp.]|nr:putative FAD-binding dehydrogenase [uncultured Ruminococcus sp.]SCH34963.1 putative FAD-binding dehydrogenase [uncultured Clostridium sp.]